MSNSIPSGNGNYSIRITRLCVVPPDEPVFSEQATVVEIDDEAAGEFVRVSQYAGHVDNAKSIAFNDDEWPVIRSAIDYMVGQCRTEEPKN